MSAVSWAVIITVAILYVYFINKAISVIYNEPESTFDSCFDSSWGAQSCDGPICSRSGYDREKYKRCQEKATLIRDSIAYVKFVALMTAGLAAFFVAFLAKQTHFKSAAALSGMLSIIWATYVNWTNFNEMMKLGLSGTTLVILGTVLYNYAI